MTNLSADSETGTEDACGRGPTGADAADAAATSLQRAARRTTRLNLPGLGSRSNAARSLFIFSETNFIRKNAHVIIEWGYPLMRWWW